MSTIVKRLIVSLPSISCLRLLFMALPRRSPAVRYSDTVGGSQSAVPPVPGTLQPALPAGGAGGEGPRSEQQIVPQDASKRSKHRSTLSVPPTTCFISIGVRLLMVSLPRIKRLRGFPIEISLSPRR